LDLDARRNGLEHLDPAKNPLIGLGMETDGDGRVTKNSYGVFNLSWQVPEHPEWPGAIAAELDEIRTRIRDTHGTPLRFLIWAGMGGSAEDKSAYNAVNLLKRGPRCYVLDSTDPAKLKAILEDMVKRSRLTLPQALRATLVVGMALGMTSYEPVVNLEKLYGLYEKHRIDSRPNFIYMTLPGSLLDQFAGPRGYRRVELQLDNANATSGRHSGPLTRGSLYPLGLSKIDLRAWMNATVLTGEQIHTAWKLSAFLHQQGLDGRDKVTLLLPKIWEGIALWTKQDFEESLGKCEELGIKIVIGEKPKMANYRAPKDALQDRVFLAIQVKGQPGPDAQKLAMLRRAGYPVAVVAFARGALLSRYMEFMHYAVFGMGKLRGMNFVTQPGVELYMSITNGLYEGSVKLGGIEKTPEWQKLSSSPLQAKWRGGVTLHYERLQFDDPPPKLSAPSLYAWLLMHYSASRAVEYGELTFFGDMRYSTMGKAVRKCLDHAAESVFRARLKMPVDVYEGPAMNHSYHEMVIGHGRCFSTVLLAEKAERYKEAGYTADYHRAQFLATQMALAERGRPVVAITLRDLEESTLKALDEFFHEVVKELKSARA
jgi:glucose-6-phosphate isomerase